MIQTKKLARTLTASAGVIFTFFSFVSISFADEDTQILLETSRRRITQGHYRASLISLHELKTDLENTRIEQLKGLLPPPPAHWSIQEENWSCQDFLHGQRVYSLNEDTSVTLIVEENSPGQEVVFVTSKLLSASEFDPGDEVIEVQGHRVLMNYHEGTDYKSGNLHMILPRPDQSRWYGGLTLLSFQGYGPGISKKILEEEFAGSLDFKSLIEILAGPPEHTDAASVNIDIELTAALSSYQNRLFWKTHRAVQALIEAMDRKRAEFIGTTLPEELPVWGMWDSGGLGGYPASVSRLFRSNEKILILLVTENSNDFPELSLQPEGAQEIKWSGKRGVQYFHPRDKRWRLVFPLRNEEAALLIIGDGVEVNDLTTVLSSLDMDRINLAIQR